MSDKKVTLLVRFKTKKGMGEKLQQAALKLFAPTRAESGCIEYKFHASEQDPDTFLFYEIWASKKDLNAHLEMPYLLAFKTLLEEILSEPPEFTYWHGLE